MGYYNWIYIYTNSEAARIWDSAIRYGDLTIKARDLTIKWIQMGHLSDVTLGFTWFLWSMIIYSYFGHSTLPIQLFTSLGSSQYWLKIHGSYYGSCAIHPFKTHPINQHPQSKKSLAMLL